MRKLKHSGISIAKNGKYKKWIATEDENVENAEKLDNKKKKKNKTKQNKRKQREKKQKDGKAMIQKIMFN